MAHTASAPPRGSSAPRPGPDPGPGGPPGGPAEVADHARSVSIRRARRSGPPGRATNRRARHPPRLDPAQPATSARWTRLTPGQVDEALKEPVVLAGVEPVQNRGGQFTWQVRRQLAGILPDVDPETAGLRIITTMDWTAQKLAERWLAAAAIAEPVQDTAEPAPRRTEDPQERAGLDPALRGKDLRNGALVALDYRTGDVRPTPAAPAMPATTWRIASSTRSTTQRAMARVAGLGVQADPVRRRVRGEALALTPGSLLLDITTEFDRRQDWAPRDADQLERGPVLSGQALQYSLNIPAIRALERVGSERVADTAAALGIDFFGGRRHVPAGRPGRCARDGRGDAARSDDRLRRHRQRGRRGQAPDDPRGPGPDGSVLWQAPEPAGERAISPETAYLVTDILEGNTDSRQNPIWAEKLALRGPDGERRPAAVKTGTTNDARDLGTYGFLLRSPTAASGLRSGSGSAAAITPIRGRAIRRRP